MHKTFKNICVLFEKKKDQTIGCFISCLYMYLLMLNIKLL